MGFLDKVKEQAAAAQVMAKDGLQKGQAKFEEAQSKRSTEGTLRDLGAAYYAKETGRSTDDGEIQRLIGVLREHEQANGALNLAATSAPDGGVVVSGATGGIPASGGVPTSSVPQSSMPASAPAEAAPVSQGLPQSTPMAPPSGSTL